MAIKKKLIPYTPSRRFMTFIDYKKELSGHKPEKSLLINLKNHAGRNNTGRITCRHKGAGNKRMYRLVDFKFDKIDIPATVKTIEYDPYRTAFIMLCVYNDGEKRYHLALNNINVGDKIITSSKNGEIKIGNRMQLQYIPQGQEISNIELKPRGGGKIIRSAGTCAHLMGLDGNYAQLKMPSGEIRLVSKECFATIGVVSNIDHNNIIIGKAGRSRWKNKRPSVLGISMNPVDHPHGGGEGHQPVGLRKGPKTPWGKPALGVRTRKMKKYSKKMIIKRRFKK